MEDGGRSGGGRNTSFRRLIWGGGGGYTGVFTLSESTESHLGSVCFSAWVTCQ